MKFFIMVLLVVLLSMACQSDFEDLEYPADAARLGVILRSDYRENPVRFRYNRADTVVSVHGKVEHIRDGGAVFFSGNLMAALGLTCKFADTRDVVGLNPGDRVVVTGVIGISEKKRVYLKDCKLHSSPTDDN